MSAANISTGFSFSSSNLFSSSRSSNSSAKFAQKVANSKVLSKLRSFKELGSYCDPHDPCCAKPDPEIYLHRSFLRLGPQLRKQCAPKNPFHFEYSILHRLKLKEKLQAVVERQDAGLFQKETKPPESAGMNPSAAYFSSNPDKLPTAPEPDSTHYVVKSVDGIGKAALCHELAVNREFKFKNPDELITEHAKIALDGKDKYWRKVDQALIKKQRHQKRVKHIIVDLVFTLKRMLLRITLPHNLTMRFRIHREFSVRKIKEEIDLNIFNFNKCMNFVLDTLSLLCCPIRDKEIVEIRDMMADKVPFSRQARRVIELMENMHLDLSNFAISQSRPHTVQNCVDYERKEFAAYIESQYRMGRDPIKITRHWIKRHSIPERDFKETMAYAFLELLENYETKGRNDWPETLALDWFRFTPIRQEIQRLVILGALVASVYDFAISLVSSKERATNNFEENQVLMLKNLRLLCSLREELNALVKYENISDSEKLYETLIRCSDKAIQVVDRYLISEHCEGLIAEEKNLLYSLVGSHDQINHTNRQLYSRRVMDWFIKVAKMEGKGTLQVPANLLVIGPLILNPITEMSRILTYNRAVFDIIYEEIFNDNCPPPSFYPNTHGQTATIILDANNPKNYNSHAMDHGITNLLEKLLESNDRGMVYRRSRVDPNVQPFYNPDGTEIYPPEQQTIPELPAITPLEQKRYDEFLLANEPTLEVDFEGIYDPNVKPHDPVFMLSQNSEQLIRLMERDNIIKRNKLRRIKKRIEKALLKKRIEENLPVFEKVWREEVGHLQKQFCRLERIHQIGGFPLPPKAQDEPRPKRNFQGTCELNKDKGQVKVEEGPKYNEKGERIMFSRNRGEKFASPARPPTGREEYDFSRFKPDSPSAEAQDDSFKGYTTRLYRYY